MSARSCTSRSIRAHRPPRRDAAGTGESRCDAAVPNTIALLELAGAAGVPVACGPEEPVGDGNEWPTEWRDAADALAGVELPRVDAPADETNAVDLLVDLISEHDEPVTVVALGPLTNLAGRVGARTCVVDDIDMLYTMGGALEVAGNAPNGTAEWNYFVDPHAVATVLDSGVRTTIVPLDATDDVPVTQVFFDRLTAAASSTPVASAVQGLMAESHSYESDFFFWDELTAALAVESLATIANETIAVETTGADAGRILRDPDGVRVRVAIAGDAARFEREYLEALTGAPVAPIELDPQEAAYFTAMQDTTKTFTDAFGALYESPLAAELEPVFTAEPATPLDAETEARVREFFTSFWTSVIDYASQYRDRIAPAAAPEDMLAVHAAYIDAITALIDSRDAHLADLSAQTGSELITTFFDEFPEIGAVEGACADLTAAASTRGVTDPICPV